MPQEMSPTYLAKSRLLTARLVKRYERHIFNPENFFAYDKTCLELDEASLITLNGKLTLNSSLTEDAGRSTILRLDRNAKLNVTHGEFQVYYGGDITVFPNGELTLGDSFINNSCRIRCGKSITIGDGCAISHNVTIIDSDFHVLIKDGVEQPRYGTGISIGNHVWIGTGVTILKNVQIGEGAVIASGALVNSDIPAHCLAVGVPAKVIDTNIDWKK